MVGAMETRTSSRLVPCVLCAWSLLATLIFNVYPICQICVRITENVSPEQDRIVWYISLHWADAIAKAFVHLRCWLSVRAGTFWTKHAIYVLNVMNARVCSMHLDLGVVRILVLPSNTLIAVRYVVQHL